MMKDDENQVELAQALAETMAEDGHEISHLDLLDYLAMLGLKLTKDEHGHASTAYVLELGDSYPAG